MIKYDTSSSFSETAPMSEQAVHDGFVGPAAVEAHAEKMGVITVQVTSRKYRRNMFITDL
jgi:hypothetical protein